MDERVRVLGIAPYEGMKTLMAALAEEYPQIDLPLFVGDMEQGLGVARSNFHGDYGVVISRGGAARILRQNLPLPVIKIEISIYGILCALKLADGQSGKTALVSFAGTAAGARALRGLLNYDLGSAEAAHAAPPPAHGLPSILCDVIAGTAVKRLGISRTTLWRLPQK